MKKIGSKFCPRCGTQNSLTDSYCIKCGYSFRRAKKSNLKTIIFIIILLVIGWIAFRTLTNQPIIPAGLSNIFQNSSYNSTG
jgi:ribosomal protein L40E